MSGSNDAISSSDLKKLRSAGRMMQPIARIGKNGLGSGNVEEIKKHLKRRGLIKVKILPHAFDEDESFDRKDFAKELATLTDSILADITGYSVVLYRQNRDGRKGKSHKK